MTTRMKKSEKEFRVCLVNNERPSPFENGGQHSRGGPPFQVWLEQGNKEQTRELLGRVYLLST